MDQVRGRAHKGAPGARRCAATATPAPRAGATRPRAPGRSATAPPPARGSWRGPIGALRGPRSVANCAAVWGGGRGGRVLRRAPRRVPAPQPTPCLRHRARRSWSCGSAPPTCRTSTSSALSVRGGDASGARRGHGGRRCNEGPAAARLAGVRSQLQLLLGSLAAWRPAGWALRLKSGAPDPAPAAAPRPVTRRPLLHHPPPPTHAPPPQAT